MTPQDIITGIIDREGRAFTNRAADKGGATKFGIDLATLSAWRRHTCTAIDVEHMNEDEARDIYEARYVTPFIGVKDEKVRVQMIDFCVTSGQKNAVTAMQQIFQLAKDGSLGPATLAAINAASPRDLGNRYAVARTKFYVNIAHAQPSQIENVNGWVNRSLSFVF